jgi:[NiFe] hydrogenase diaphorase moiety large subunit
MFTHSPKQQRAISPSFDSLDVESELLKNEIDKLVELYGESRNALIPILQEIRHRHTFISSFAMQYVADRLGVSAAEVYGVISFYSFLKEDYHGKFTISLCRTISCDMSDKARVAKQLENQLGIKFGETTQDGIFSLEWTNCIGMCDESPAMLVNEQVFTKVTPNKIKDILDGCRKTYQQNKQMGA